MCQHLPACPAAHAPDRTAARMAAAHPGPGWSLRRAVDEELTARPRAVFFAAILPTMLRWRPRSSS
jgi:hypothetical protein